MKIIEVRECGQVKVIDFSMFAQIDLVTLTFQCGILKGKRNKQFQK